MGLEWKVTDQGGAMRWYAQSNIPVPAGQQPLMWRINVNEDGLFCFDYSDPAIAWGLEPVGKPTLDSAKAMAANYDRQAEECVSFAGKLMTEIIRR